MFVKNIKILRRLTNFPKYFFQDLAKYFSKLIHFPEKPTKNLQTYKNMKNIMLFYVSYASLFYG